MSWLSSGLKAVGKGITGVAHGVGDALDNKWTKAALAAGLAATGVGAPAAAAIMAGSGLAGGALKRGGNLGTALKGGATGALEGYGASKLGGLKAVGGKMIGSVVGGGDPNAGMVNAGLSNEFGDFTGDGGGSGPGGDGGQSWWQKGLGFLGDHVGDITKAGLGVGAGIEGIKNSREAAALNKDALARIQAPLNAPDLSGLFADKSNPFARTRRLPVVGSK